MLYVWRDFLYINCSEYGKARDSYDMNKKKKGTRMSQRDIMILNPNEKFLKVKKIKEKKRETCE